MPFTPGSDQQPAVYGVRATGHATPSRWSAPVVTPWTPPVAGILVGRATFARPLVARRLFGDPSTFRRHYLAEGRGKYRVFNGAEYRLYRSNAGPPLETDTPFATTPTLPFEPSDLFADGTWWLSVSWFNGVIDSGFLPLGPKGETYIRLDLSGGQTTNRPPYAPESVRLEVRPAGVIRVVGLYIERGALRATQWAMTYTTDGSTPGTPPAVTPTATEAMNTSGGVAALLHDLPAQADGTTVKVRTQTRRLDGSTWLYSEGSTVLTATADTTGPAAASNGTGFGSVSGPGSEPI